MPANDKSFSVDAISEIKAIQKIATAEKVPESRVTVKSKRSLMNGLTRFECLIDREPELDIDALIAKVDSHLQNIENKQVIHNYSSVDLEQLGIYGGIDNDEELKRNSIETTVSGYNIPKGIDYFECDEVLVHDYKWLQSCQKINFCVSGAILAFIENGTIDRANQMVGQINFVPPLKDDFSLIMPKQNGKRIEFQACLPGRLLISGGKLFLLPIDVPSQIANFQVHDGMSVTCDLLPPFGKGRLLDLDSVLTYLTYCRIKFGVKSTVIEESLKKVNFSNQLVERVVVARGMPAMPGKDAQIEHEFAKDIDFDEFEIKDDGTIDYHRKLKIPTANEGDLLARITIPSSGQPGLDVYGNMILAPNGKEYKLTAGEGVRCSPDGREFYATRVGLVYYGPDSIQVLPVFFVDQDVDSHFGNVVFDGTVIVRGSVMQGFSVKAKGNVEITGEIQGGVVEAGRDLKVEGGIFGGPNAVVKVGRNLIARHLLNAVVEVEGDVHILNSCVHSTVDTTGMFFCMEGKGVVMGGAIMAMRGVKVKELGAEIGVKTLVVCGQDFLMQKKITETKKIKASLYEDLKKVDNYLKPLLTRIQSHTVQLDESQMKKVGELAGYRKQLEMNHNIMIKRLDRLESSSVMPDGVKVNAYFGLFPGVRVQICTNSWVADKIYNRLALSSDPSTGKIRLGHI